MKKILVTILVTNVVALCMSASIIDFISGTEGGRQSDAGSRNCICKDLSCICCLDFNISFIDLGGPGCVVLSYLSPEKGIAINVSYGSSLLHNEILKGGPDPPPSCLNIFAQLAQLCAKFSGLMPSSDDGLKGCVSLQPSILGEAQLDLPIGCFQMSSQRGMELIQSPNEIINEQKPLEPEIDNGNSTNGDSEGPDSLAGYTAEDILAAVNESAETGLQLITNWFGIVTPNATDEAAPEANNVSPEPVQSQYVTETNHHYSPQSSNSGHVVFGS